MTTTKSLAITDLRMPQSAKRNSVIANLTDSGRQDFLSELTEALDGASETGRLNDVQHVIDAWWVSGTFGCHPRFEKALAATYEMDDEQSYDAPALRAKLG